MEDEKRGGELAPEEKEEDVRDKKGRCNEGGDNTKTDGTRCNCVSAFGGRCNCVRVCMHASVGR